MGNNCCRQKQNESDLEEDFVPKINNSNDYYERNTNLRAAKLSYHDIIQIEDRLETEKEENQYRVKNGIIRKYDLEDSESAKKIQNSFRTYKAKQALSKEISSRHDQARKSLQEQGRMIHGHKIEDYYAPRVKEVESLLSKREKHYNSDKIPNEVHDRQFNRLKESITRNSQYTFIDIFYVNEQRNHVYKGYIDREFKPHLWGIYVDEKGSKHEGEFKHGICNGTGRLVKDNGNIHYGNFEDGKLQGYGVYVGYVQNIYVGEWKDDLLNGRGEEFFSDGSRYKGTFKNGRKAGTGTFEWADGSTYSGSIENDILHGFGTYEWKDGKKYTGEWINNLMHGKGFFKYEDGTSYDGEFKDNLRHGFGKFSWDESRYYLGEWRNGKQNGDGKYYKGQKLVIGKWNNGKLEKIIEEKSLK